MSLLRGPISSLIRNGNNLLTYMNTVWKSIKQFVNKWFVRVWARQLGLSLLLVVFNKFDSRPYSVIVTFENEVAFFLKIRRAWEEGIVEDQCRTFEYSVVHSATLKAIWYSVSARHLWNQYILLRQQRKKLIISNINNYKVLHLHRTFHFKTLRDLSKGKERLF